MDKDKKIAENGSEEVPQPEGFRSRLRGFFRRVWKVLSRPWKLLTRPPQRCYRCGSEVVVEFMALPYCRICFDVVTAMLPIVQHDPPPGFPGAGPGDIYWMQRQLERGEK